MHGPARAVNPALRPPVRRARPGCRSATPCGCQAAPRRL